jgi:hypothetical protein
MELKDLLLCQQQSQDFVHEPDEYNSPPHILIHINFWLNGILPFRSISSK